MLPHMLSYIATLASTQVWEQQNTVEEAKKDRLFQQRGPARDLKVDQYSESRSEFSVAHMQPLCELGN